MKGKDEGKICKVIMKKRRKLCPLRVGKRATYVYLGYEKEMIKTFRDKKRSNLGR